MVRSLVIEDGLLYASAYPERICVWDLETKRMVHDFNKGNFLVDGMLISDGVLYSAPFDKLNKTFRMRAWDFNAADEEILKRLAQLFRLGQTTDMQYAVRSLSALPRRIEKESLKPLPGPPKDFFWGLRACNGKRARAFSALCQCDRQVFRVS